MFWCILEPVGSRNIGDGRGVQRMFVEVDVLEGANCSLTVNRMFMGLAEPVRVKRIIAPDPFGNEVNCTVTGRSCKGPCDAFAVPVKTREKVWSYSYMVALEV